MSSDQSSDLGALLPGQEVTVNSEVIRVVPLFFGQYPTAIKLVRPLADVIKRSGAFSVKQVQGPDGKPKVAFDMTEDWLSAMPMVLEEGGEALIRFFAFCINKKREWFDTVSGDAGLLLANAILQENRDFFVQKILPTLTALGWMTAKTDGEPSSLPSTATATTGQTSSE